MGDLVESKTEILKDKFIFLNVKDGFKPPTESPYYIYFTTDKTLVYTSFFADFGPLDIGLTYQFCQQLNELLNSVENTKKVVVYYSLNCPHYRANSAVLICAYLIFVLNYSIERAYAPFIGIDPPFINFRDAAFSINTFSLTVLDCARAMKKAVIKGHFNFREFSFPTYQKLTKLQNGDISWVIPRKFIAFSGPVAKRRKISPGVFFLSPAEYVPLFKSLGVSCVIRFNNKCYDSNIFTSSGIRHVDLFYEDGGNPSENILQSFLQICEAEKGGIAVHCKAGLGRTGTNIAAYMIKHYGYSVKEATAWLRITRPGSVVGPQQHYLAAIEERLIYEGSLYYQRIAAAVSTAPKEEEAISEGVATQQLALTAGSSSLYSKLRGMSLIDPSPQPLGETVRTLQRNPYEDNTAANRGIARQERGACAGRAALISPPWIRSSSHWRLRGGKEEGRVAAAAQRGLGRRGD